MLPAMVHVPEPERPASFPVIATWAWRRWTLTRLVLIPFGQGLDIAYGPCAVTCLPFQSFDLPKKLCRECCFAPEALIARVASQARVHVTHSRVEGAPENAQFLLAQFKQHVRRASRSR
jgi:hypothetical protein